MRDHNMYYPNLIIKYRIGWEVALNFWNAVLFLHSHSYGK